MGRCASKPITRRYSHKTFEIITTRRCSECLFVTMFSAISVVPSTNEAETTKRVMLTQVMSFRHDIQRGRNEDSSSSSSSPVYLLALSFDDSHALLPIKTPQKFYLLQNRRTSSSRTGHLSFFEKTMRIFM